MNVPGSDTAPGPGRLADEFTTPFWVASMQKTDARVALAGTPGVIGPAGDPFSVIFRHVDWPKQPADTCGADVCGGTQNLPFASLEEVAGAVVSGERFTAIGPTCEEPGSTQRPPPGVHGWVASAPPVGQSRVMPVGLVVVHAMPTRGLRSQVPVPGLLGVPVTEHFGQGWFRLPVM